MHFELELTQPDALWKETCWYTACLHQVPNMVLIMYQVVCEAGRSTRDCATEV